MDGGRNTLTRNSVQYQTNSDIGDVAIRQDLSQIASKKRGYYPLTESWTKPGPYWDGVVQDTMSTGATDWEGEFYPSTTTATVTNRVPTRRATAGGELLSIAPTGNSSYSARTFKLTVYALQPQTIPIRLQFTGTGGDVQVKINGLITAHSATSGLYNAWINVDWVAGYNSISVSTDTLVDSLEIEGRLFDGINVQWVDPNASRNPTRTGYTSTGSGGGVGSGPFSTEITGGPL